jgi:hypothetical protein
LFHYKANYSLDGMHIRYTQLDYVEYVVFLNVDLNDVR